MLVVLSYNHFMEDFCSTFNYHLFFSPRDQRLKENDQILAVNHTPLDLNISHQQAILLLQQSTGSLHLVVARGPTQSSSRNSSAMSDANVPEMVR